MVFLNPQTARQQGTNESFWLNRRGQMASPCAKAIFVSCPRLDCPRIFTDSLPQNEDIKIRSILQAHGKVGAAVDKLLPKDLNSKIREQIEAATKPPGSPPLPGDNQKAAPDLTADSAHGSAAGGTSPDAEGRFAASAAASPTTKAEGTRHSSALLAFTLQLNVLELDSTCCSIFVVQCGQNAKSIANLGSCCRV
jgi:hypothetical protein